MIFITDSDLTLQIRNEVKAAISGSDNAIYNKAELTAIEEITSYLSGRYNTPSIFAQTGTNRNPLIIMYCIDIMIYHIHSRTPGRNVPEMRKERYDAAIAWLLKVSQGKLNPLLPILENAEQGIFRLGGNEKRTQGW